MTRLEKQLADLLVPYVDPDALHDVVRRPVDALRGRSMLEAAEAGEIEAVKALAARIFDLGRVQP